MVLPVKKAIEDAMMVVKKLPKMGEMKEIFKIVWRVERFIKDNGSLVKHKFLDTFIKLSYHAKKKEEIEG